MLTAKKAREMLDNRDMAPYFKFIELCIADNEDHAIFLDETVPWFGLHLNEEKRNKLLSLGYKIETTKNHSFSPEWLCWKVSW
jgi:hypothetical protein